MFTDEVRINSLNLMMSFSSRPAQESANHNVLNKNTGQDIGIGLHHTKERGNRIVGKKH